MTARPEAQERPFSGGRAEVRSMGSGERPGPGAARVKTGVLMESAGDMLQVVS